MSNRLGIDFGTSNTAIAVWDEMRRQARLVHVPEFGQLCALQGQSAAAGPAPPATPAPVSLVPSVIHYAADGRRWIGDQVRQRGLLASERTFSLMKRYIANRSPVTRRWEGQEYSHFEAGRDFLTAVLQFAVTELEASAEEAVLTMPVEAYEHYVDWLTGVADAAGLRRLRLLDEPAAAALGYGAHIQPGHVYLIFDFGGGTLDVAVVLIEAQEQVQGGRRCRVLGKAGKDLGGSTLDAWLLADFLRQQGRHDTDDDIRSVSAELLGQCRAAKEALSQQERAAIRVRLPQSGADLATEFTRGQFEELLDRHELFRQVDQTLRRALNSARERGYAEEHIQAVLLVGGSSLIPAVQKTVQRIFGKERIRLEHPLDAVARGAAAVAAGIDFYDHIQHDYAIRWTNPQKGDYDYRVIVQRGTPYPTTEPVARLTIKASHPGQTELGIAIFELGEQMERGSSQPVELVFDPAGAARMVQLSPEEATRRTHFWINESNPTFLRANPPAPKGEARFAVEFGIDGNKRLLITAHDLKTGEITHQDFPVVKLV